MDRADPRVSAVDRKRGAIPVDPTPGARARALPLGPALAYAGALAVFAVWGLYGVTVKALVTGLFLVAAGTRRLDRFVRDWAIFLAGVALFDSLRAGVFAAVRALELGLPPVRSGLWLVRREAFERFVAAMLLVMGLGVVGYLAAPTIPPWMAARLGAIPPIHRVADHVYSQAIPGLRRTFDTNPIAAMPSLHAAFAAICTLVAFHELGPWGWALAAYLGLASLAAVTLREHYFIDLAAG